MASASLKKLRARASMAMRNSDFDEALAAYRELEKREPQNHIWPQRRAEIREQQGLRSQAIKGFDHALGMAIDRGEIIGAIALCKQILVIEPAHRGALDRLQRLCGEPEPPEPSAAQPNSPIKVAAKFVDGPLEEMLLTEALPRSGPDVSSNLDDSGIVEIPLTEIVQDDISSPRAESGRNGAREQLLRTPLFGSLDAASLRGLIENVELVSLDEDEVLFRQGDPADTLYVVANGAVVPIAEEDSRKKLAVLEAGAFFGEIGLMTNLPRNATIQAIVESRLLAIDRKAMWALIRKNPAVLEVMLCFLRDRLVDRLTRTNPLFAAFPAKQRASVAKLFRFFEVRSGSRLIEQGHTSENLFALLAGSAQVIKMDIDSDKVIAELEPGEIFGEMSLLEQTPAIAAVVASSKCWVLALSRERLMRLLAKNEQAAAVLKRTVADREGENSDRNKSPLEAGSGADPTS